MSAYIIVYRETPVADAESFAEYGRLNRAAAPETQASFKLRPLSVYGPTEALEGVAPDGVVLLEFPDMETARAWYHSPAYQEALGHRLKAAKWRVVLVEGL
ncbi:MAG: DUF1330 domain-containing protein [Novosphingobium sp.]|nr:DUF1330 domain-containing protein [Novosphingobium sp.]